MNAKSTKSKRPSKAAIDKPPKPYPDFPLTTDATGSWQKKIRGKIHYFGRWGRIRNGKIRRLPSDGWQEALELYKAQADDLHAGRTLRVKGDGLTIRDLCNRFLTAKKRQVDSGEIAALTFDGYRQTTELIVAAFGRDRLVDDLASEDFEAVRESMYTPRHS